MAFFGLIGERLGHSLSVPIHENLLRAMGWPGAYQLIEIPRERFSQVGPALTLLGFRGVNVTLPYKVDILPQLDGLDDFARQVGAVNTVLNDGGRLMGYNTDVYGLIEMLRFHRLAPGGLPCAVLGSGGAARAAAAALLALGAPRVTVISRRPHGGESWGDRVGFADYKALAAMAGGLLVNATPVGMHPHADACPVTPRQMAGFQGCADLIYNPGETRFAAQARALGLPACTGLYMLVAQAVKAEEIWWGKPVPPEVTREIYQSMAKEMAL